MPRETVDAKSIRLLAERRVRIVSITTTAVKAVVRGSDTEWRVLGFASGWSCTCPARGVCSHITAVQRVVLKPTTPERKHP